MLATQTQVDTNRILKSMVSNINKYQKNSFIRGFGLDIQNLYPIYFNDQKYKKELHENYYFFFIDNEFRLMGILKGNEWDKKNFAIFEYYTPLNNYSAYMAVAKNRRNLTAAATHILMITPEMQNPEISNSNKSKYKANKREDHRKALNRRLQEFKTKRREGISHERVLHMVQEVIGYLNEHLFDSEEEKRQICNKLGSWSSSYYRELGNMAERGENYLKKYNELTALKIPYNYDWMKRDVDDYKNEIIDIYKKLLEKSK